MSGRLREVITSLVEAHGFVLNGSEYRTLYLTNAEGFVLTISILGVLSEIEIAHYYPGEQNTLCPAPSVIFEVNNRIWQIIQIDTWPELEINISRGQTTEALVALNRLEILSTTDVASFLEQFAQVILDQWASVPHTASLERPTWFPNLDEESLPPENFPY